MHSLGKLLNLGIALALLLSTPWATGLTLANRAPAPDGQTIEPSAAALQMDWRTKVDPWVLETAGLPAEGELPEGSALAALPQTEFLVYLSEQADLSSAAALPTRAEKGRYVYEQLSALARRTQPAVVAELERLGVSYRPFWVANMIWVRGNAHAVQALAQRRDVTRLYANPQVQLSLPEVETPSERPLSVAAGVEWNITKVRAPEVWAAGLTGQGVVVGGQDTGYDWTHSGLKAHYRGWDGSAADHNYNWHDAIHSDSSVACPADSTAPCDGQSHGTHTMGTMVGDDGAGNQVGMAPGAQWIGCRNMNSAGAGTPASYTECYQWFIAPTDLNDVNPDPSRAPDVINNSWSCPQSEGCTDPLVLLAVVNAVRAAGILTVHSAGNSGGSCSTVSTPAAIYDASFTVGNTTSSDTIYGNSSRGPVTVDGSGRIKPDIAAPGTGIRSTTPNNNYGIMNGTSMAGPHVAGLAALLISARPDLAGQPDRIEALIEENAVHLTAATPCSEAAGAIPNNTFGWGRIDAWAAYQGHALQVGQWVGSSQVLQGGQVTYTLAVTHTAILSPTTSLVITQTLPLKTSLAGASEPYSLDENTVQWTFSAVDAGQVQAVTLTVQVPLTATGVLTNTFGASSLEVPRAIRGEAASVQIVPQSAVELSPSKTLLIAPGEQITYTHSLTNTGSTSDTYQLNLSATVYGWPVGLNPPGPVTLLPGETTALSIGVQAPEGASPGQAEQIRVEAISQADPQISAVVTDTLRAGYYIYLPFLTRID